MLVRLIRMPLTPLLKRKYLSRAYTIIEFLLMIERRVTLVLFIKRNQYNSINIAFCKAYQAFAEPQRAPLFNRFTVVPSKLTPSVMPDFWEASRAGA
jgi:hypothetical protein